MSLLSSLSRNLLVALALSGTLGLAGCSGLRPVYGQPGTGVEAHTFSYSEPANRFDQIIYSELRLRLGPPSAAPDAVRVTVSSSSGSRLLTKSAVVRPSGEYQMVVAASVTVVGADGQQILSASRQATASYQAVGQVLADIAAQTEAGERAAKSLAETLRLTIIAALERA